MRIWDIVDNVYPGTPIVEIHKEKRRARGLASSAAHWVFAVGLAVASAGTFIVSRHCDSNYVQRVQVSADSYMTPETAATLLAMRNYAFDARVADLEPDSEEPIGYSYPR